MIATDVSSRGKERSVVVWGNCQAAPVAALLAAPLAECGLRVEPTEPVFLADETEVARVHDLVRSSAFLVSQPIGDDYRIAGSSTARLARLLPTDGRLVTFPVTFHVGPFPAQVNAHGGDGARVNAPLTDYHDLRAVVAAERGLDAEAALAWWPAPSVDAVREISARSVAELRRRESTLDVATSTLLDRPDAMLTISHPSNVTLAAIAAGILARLGIDHEVAAPAREFLGQRQAPVEPSVLKAHGWSAGSARPNWRIDGHDVDLATIVRAHLAFYRDRPDVVLDTRVRYAERLALLGW